MKRSRSVSLSCPLGSSKTAVLAPVAVASALVLGGCDFGGREYTTLADCEARNGSGACMQEPRPVEMNEENRPAYVKADDCMKDFGEEQCKEEEHKGRRVYRPIYTPGQTYFYNSGGQMGYYKGSITTAPPTYSPFVRKFGFGGSARAFGAVASGG